MRDYIEEPESLTVDAAMAMDAFREHDWSHHFVRSPEGDESLVLYSSVADLPEALAAVADVFDDPDAARAIQYNGLHMGHFVLIDSPGPIDFMDPQMTTNLSTMIDPENCATVDAQVKQMIDGGGGPRAARALLQAARQKVIITEPEIAPGSAPSLNDMMFE